VTRRSYQRARVLFLGTVVSWWVVIGSATAAPTNNTLPAISGTAQQGQVLSLQQGSWSDVADPTITITDEWDRCTPTCQATGQTGPSYSLGPADVGSTIEVLETASTGTDGSAQATSSPTATVTALPPSNTAPPVLGGTPQEGQLLTVTHGTWTNSPTISDQWERCGPTGTGCVAIGGQTGGTYMVIPADVGHTIRATETASNTGGTASASTNASAVIVAPPGEVSAPSISGLAQQGAVLTESHGTWTGAPTSFSYQWERCIPSPFSCTTIPLATAQTYTPTVADVGAAILVLETASNAGGPGAAASSPLTGVVTTPAGVVPVPVSVSAPSVSGTARQGQTLREANGTWSGNPASYQYQWESCDGLGCAPIPGATDQSYTPTASDVGRTLTVLETANNPGGSSLPAASDRTAVVSAVSATSLVASPGAPNTNQIVTLVATVSSGSGNAPPAGAVTFFDGNTPIGACENETFRATNGAVATLICQRSFPAGTATVTAVFTPRASVPVAGSASEPMALAVGRDSTSTSLAVTKEVGLGNRARFTATVVLPLSNSGPLQPTGSIEFLDRGRPIRGCRSSRLTKLTATCAVSFRSLGKHQISARYIGDANFASSSSPPRPVQIVKHTSGPIVRGFVTSTLQWSFHYRPTFTKVIGFTAEGLVSGTKLVLTCTGASCPFSRISLQPQAGSMDLLPLFKGRRLRVGTQITVRMTRPDRIGKYYSFTIRAGRSPLIVLSCLGVGMSQPGSGC
jgi:Bacterial Ig-like domain (group 3)